VDSVTPDEPRRAPIRWHVATVRDARTESPTARTLVLDGVFDLAALEDLAVGQHADAHSTLLTPRRRSAEGGESGAPPVQLLRNRKHRTPLLRRQPELSGFPISIPDAIKVGRTVFADLMKEP
jgi:hypothetical protein